MKLNAKREQKMKLIGSPTHPLVRKVRVVLAEKKIDCDLVPETEDESETELQNFNPLGEVPVLVLDDHTALFDSRVIVQYIDNLAPNAKLFPGTNRDRTEVKRWEAVADGIAEAALAIAQERSRPKTKQSADWVTRYETRIVRGLAFLAQELGNNNPYCMGTHLSMADIAVGATLDYLCLRHPEIDWQTEYPQLNALYQKLLQRQSFIDTQSALL